MKDFDVTLDESEAISIRACLGEIPSTFARVFVWAESADQITVSIEIEGEEKFAVRVADRGNRIKATPVTKEKPGDATGERG